MRWHARDTLVTCELSLEGGGNYWNTFILWRWVSAERGRGGGSVKRVWQTCLSACLSDVFVRRVCQTCVSNVSIYRVCQPCLSNVFVINRLYQVCMSNACVKRVCQTLVSDARITRACHTRVLYARDLAWVSNVSHKSLIDDTNLTDTMLYVSHKFYSKLDKEVNLSYSVILEKNLVLL